MLVAKTSGARPRWAQCHTVSIAGSFPDDDSCFTTGRISLIRHRFRSSLDHMTPRRSSVVEADTVIGYATCGIKLVRPLLDGR